MKISIWGFGLLDYSISRGGGGQKAGTIKVKIHCQKKHFVSKHLIPGLQGVGKLLLKPEEIIVDLVWKWLDARLKKLYYLQWSAWDLLLI